MIEMELVGVRMEMPSNTPVVVLREQVGQQRLLPILIGTPEASAIHTAAEGIVPPRPLTHDLMATLLGHFGTALVRVVITEIRDHTFFAELHLRRNETLEIISCRPSDAIAIAVRLDAPIFATDELVDEVGQVPAADEDSDEEAILDEFREFLDDLDPSDFQAD